MKTSMLLIVFALSIVVNAAAGFIAGSPMILWGVNPWTLALTGALLWPLSRMFYFVASMSCSALLTVLCGPLKARTRG